MTERHDPIPIWNGGHVPIESPPKSTGMVDHPQFKGTENLKIWFCLKIGYPLYPKFSCLYNPQFPYIYTPWFERAVVLFVDYPCSTAAFNVIFLVSPMLVKCPVSPDRRRKKIARYTMPPYWISSLSSHQKNPMFDCWITILNACKKTTKIMPRHRVFSMLLAKKCLALRLCGAAIFVQQNGAQEWSIFLPWLKVLGNARTMVGDIWPILMRKGGPMLSTLKFCWSIFSSIFVVSGPFLLSEDSDSSGDRPTLPASGCGHHLLVMPGQSQMPCKKSLYIIYNIVYNIVFHNIVL